MYEPKSYDPEKRKLLSILCHGSIFFSTLVLSVGVPIAILFISDDPIVKENAKESINFHFNVWFWGLVIGVLGFLTLGLLLFVLGPIGYLLHWGLSIWAIVHCFNSPNQSFRYPFILRLL
ncbi:MAG: DUF4870 domain-containing protein [Leptolyngbyaceae cyanobacterium SL_7_1]|nr:DUF4870 domain-containing protein [Leptolyngbyaceae cyanobacterium SL_7_1]